MDISAKTPWTSLPWRTQSQEGVLGGLTEKASVVKEAVWTLGCKPKSTGTGVIRITISYLPAPEIDS